MIRTAAVALALALTSANVRANGSDTSAGTLVAASLQLVVVTTADWQAKTGRLQRYARPTVDAGWQPVGAAFDVVVGHKGLALAADAAAIPQGVTSTLPRKQEGDGKAPAGVFRLTRVFGKDIAPRSGLPSSRTSADSLCIDDVTHPAYNRVLAWPKSAEPKPKSAEQMLRTDTLYDVVVVVDHNGAGAAGTIKPGAGSCVFLHVWRASDKGTAGCTAMRRANIDELVAWLDARQHPVLLQLPQAAYAQTATSQPSWLLPKH